MMLHIPDNSKVKISFSNGEKRKGILLSWDQDSILLRMKDGNDLIINNPDRHVMMIEVVGGGTRIDDESQQPAEPLTFPQEESVESIEARHLTRFDIALDDKKNQIAEHRKEWTSQATNPVPSFQPIGIQYERPAFKK